MTVIQTEVELCDECRDELSPNENHIQLDGGTAHVKCAFQCNGCDNYYRVGERHYEYEDYCDSCGDDLFECDRCGDLTDNDEKHYVGRYDDDDAASVYCDYCVENYAYYCDRHSTYHRDSFRCGHDFIEPYEYKPSPIFHGVEFDLDFDRNMFMGFELEVEDVECANDGTNIVRDALGNLVYFKYDGSLNDGFEIVSHPMTLAYAHQLEWSWTKKLTNHGYRSWDTDTCGLHVHVDKRAFTGRKHMYAFSLLLMRNRSLSYLVSGREGNHYAQFDKDLRLEIPKYLKNKPNHLERYSAVNVLNRSTIEVRMFKGSLKPERIMSALEYVHAAVDYSRNTKTGASSGEYLTAPAFIQWIRSNAKTYPNLTKYINDSTEFGFNDKARVYVDYRGE